MALIPFVFCDWEDLVSHSLLDENFGRNFRRPKQMSLPVEKTISSYLNLIPHQDYQEFNELKDMLDLATRRYESPRAFSVNKDDFQVMLDVQHFKPEELEVKVVDNYVVVTAKHEDKRDDHGWVSRQFVRRYQLPKDVNVEELTSQLSSDGLLTIVAPKKQPLKDEIERTLQIECTGKPFVNKKQEKPKTMEQSEEKKPE